MKSKRQTSMYGLAFRNDDLNSIQEHYCGKMDVICPECFAMFFKGETMKCCKNGDLCLSLYPILQKFENIPDVFKKLYDGDHEYSEDFFKQIRTYNKVMSFSSLGISPGLKRRDAIIVDSSLGAFTIKFHGEIYHQIGSLLPEAGKERKFSQIFFYETEYEEFQRRVDVMRSHKVPVNEELLNLIQSELYKCNQMYNLFKPIGRQMLEKEDHVMVIVDDYKQLRIQCVPKQDIKRYNKPSSNDMGIIIPEMNNDLIYSRDIIIQRQDNVLERISESHPAVDTLSYVLFFLTGQLGWSPDMKFKKQTSTSDAKQGDQFSQEEKEDLDFEPEKNQEEELKDPHLDYEKSQKERQTGDKSMRSITLAMFMLFFLHVRKESFNLLFKGKCLFFKKKMYHKQILILRFLGRKLFHTYILNKWIDIETIRLLFFRNNQRKLRVDLYLGLMEAIANSKKPSKIGKPFILPSNYKRSPRQMFELYQDSMAIVAKYGKEL